VRAVLRFVASVMIVSGTLLIADAGLTLLWQEPITALLAQREQAQLEDALANPPQRVVRRRPLPGDAIGKIDIPEIGTSEFLVEGTDTGNLRKGPGHYPDTPLPGERGTVGVAGHRTTYGAPFRRLDELERGDRIVMSMPYGRFEYRFEESRIVEPDAVEVKTPVGYQRLMLSACHPLYSAAQRIIVFARFSGRSAPELREESSRDSKKSTSPTSRASEMTSTASQ
jgi:sortase A